MKNTHCQISFGRIFRIMLRSIKRQEMGSDMVLRHWTVYQEPLVQDITKMGRKY